MLSNIGQRLIDSCRSDSPKAMKFLKNKSYTFTDVELNTALIAACNTRTPNGIDLVNMLIDAGASPANVCFYGCKSQDICELVIINGALKAYYLESLQFPLREHHVKALLNTQNNLNVRVLQKLLSCALVNGLTETAIVLLDTYHVPVTERVIIDAFDYSNILQSELFKDDVCLYILKLVDPGILSSFSSVFTWLTSGYNKSLEYLLDKGIRPNLVIQEDMFFEMTMSLRHHPIYQESCDTLDIFLKHNIKSDLPFCFVNIVNYENKEMRDRLVYLLFDYGLDRRFLID